MLTTTAVNDYTGTPKSTKELAKAMISLIDAKKYGMYHAACEGECTWFEFASKIFEFSHVDINIKPCTSKEFTQLAKRPSYSVLENKNLKERLKYTLPDWKDALEDFIKGMSL